MKDVVIVALYFCVVAFYLGALAWLIKNNASGWGWFLVAGALLLPAKINVLD